MVLIGDTMFTNLSVVKESGFKNASFKFRLGSSLNQIEKYAFYNAGIYGELQNSLTEVPFRAFAYSKLEHFRASTITKLGVEAFANASLKSYDGGNNAVDAIPENEGVLGGQFRNCYDLVDVNIKSFDIITEYMFYSCKSIIKLEFKDQMMIMNDHAFQYCENLSKVVMPSKLKYVGKRSHGVWDGYFLFSYTNLSEIDIPEIDNGIMGVYTFAHLRTKKLTINKKTNTRFKFGYYAFHNNKATKDDPFTYNFEGYYQNWLPINIFSYNTYLRFNNQNKDVQLYSDYQYTSKGLIYDNTNIYTNFPEWDGQYVNNRSTFAIGRSASKLDIAGDYTFPASITTLKTMNEHFGGGSWLGKVTGKVYLNNVSSMIPSYFDPYYPFDNIPSPHYDFVENSHFTIDKVNGYFIQNGRVVASINDEYYGQDYLSQLYRI